MNDEIRQLSYDIVNAEERLFRLQQEIKALRQKKEALMSEYKVNHPYLYKGWDVS